MALTAAHCVAAIAAADPIDLFVGERVVDGGEVLPTVDRLRHPGWSFDVLPYDIALVALAEDAPVPPLPPSRRAIGDADIGAAVDLVGFGLATEGGSDAGIKRTGASTIGGFDEMRLAIGPGPPAVCSGDSGGPTLRTIDGETAVIGVHSRSSCDDLSLDERVDVHAASFIDPFIADHPAECTDEPCDGGCRAGTGGTWLLAVLLAGLGVRSSVRRPGAAGPRGRRRPGRCVPTGRPCDTATAPAGEPSPRRRRGRPRSPCG